MNKGLIVVIILGTFFSFIIVPIIIVELNREPLTVEQQKQRDTLYGNEQTESLSEQAEKERQEMFESIAQKEKEFELEKQGAELEKQKELEEQKSLQIEMLGGLPVSCDGVLTTENDSYPTATKCVHEMGQGFYDLCLREERKISIDGVEDRAYACLVDIVLGLRELCEESVIGSYTSCMMGSMQELYREMIVK